MSPAGGGGLNESPNHKRPGVDNIPFIVKKGDVSITVLGTHFNVNAYDDEDALRVTLLEGSVQVSAKLPGLPFSAVKIKPGEQAVVTPNSKPQTLHPDLDEVMAWKNGQFIFRNASLHEIMREAARWYNIQVAYDGTAGNDRFEGELSRTTNLSELMKILAAGGVKYKIEGNKVIIMK
jgi:transmembrane sensor